MKIIFTTPRPIGSISHGTPGDSVITFHGDNELRYFIYSALPFELGQRYVTKFFKSKFVVVVSKPIHVPFKFAKSINDIIKY